MTCVVVTRNGNGGAWLFGSAEEARLHPVVQSWDVMAESATALLFAYGRAECRRLASMGPKGPVGAVIAGAMGDWSVRDCHETRAEAIRAATQVWEYLVRMSKRPPRDPAEIVSVIREDRRAVEGRVIVMRSGTARSEEYVVSKGSKSEREKAPAKSEDSGEEKETKAVVDKSGDRRPRISDESVITVVSEKNPKREGSKSFHRFAAYRDGMTVKEAKEAGVLAGDVAYDLGHGYIKLTGGEPAAAEENSDSDGEADSQQAA